jgi:hypothetical protein
MSNITLNTPSFIEAQQYSQFILRTLPTAILPQGFYRDVSDFGAGSTLNIKTIGTATIQEVEEDSPLIYNAIETGNVTLSITDYIGDAWYVTDILRQDGSQIEALMAARAQEATRAIQQRFESRFYQVAYNGQTAANPNNVNGFTHRFRAQGTNWTMSEDDLIAMRLAFDKANVPQFGRVAIVDPVVAATFQKKVVITSQLDRLPAYQSIMENGFNNEHQFVMRIHGWDIWTSNLLPQVAAGTSVDGNASSSASTTCVANLFMCIADDNCKPVMNAWRQPPKVEGERNKDRQRDEFLTTARWGMGIQRRDTLGVIVSDAVKTA